MPANTIVKRRRGTSAAWTAANPILPDGQLGFETDTGLYKLGDGVTAWTSLAYPDFLTEENGSWVPSLEGSPTSGSPTVAAAAGEYTKIGSLVRISGYAFNDDTGTAAGSWVITGLPFEPAVNDGVYPGGVGYMEGFVYTGYNACGFAVTGYGPGDSGVFEINKSGAVGSYAPVAGSGPAIGAEFGTVYKTSE